MDDREIERRAKILWTQENPVDHGLRLHSGCRWVRTSQQERQKRIESAIGNECAPVNDLHACLSRQVPQASAICALTTQAAG